MPRRPQKFVTKRIVLNLIHLLCLSRLSLRILTLNVEKFWKETWLKLFAAYSNFQLYQKGIISFRFIFGDVLERDMSRHGLHLLSSRLPLAHFKTTNVNQIKKKTFCLLTNDEQRYHISRNEKFDMAMSTLVKEKTSWIYQLHKHKDWIGIAYRLLRVRLADRLGLK